MQHLDLLPSTSFGREQEPSLVVKRAQILDIDVHLDSSSVAFGKISPERDVGYLVRGKVVSSHPLRATVSSKACDFKKQPAAHGMSITCMCLLPGDLIAVGINDSNSEGRIAIHHTPIGEPVRIFRISDPVYSITVIEGLLAGKHKFLDSADVILAIGTLSGHIYLVNPCLNDEFPGGDLNFVELLEPESANFEQDCVTKIEEGMFPALLINGRSVKGKTYVYSVGGEAMELREEPAGELAVTCLTVAHQLTTLCAGFTSGIVQLYDLFSLKCLHTMELKEECPVRHLAFMEPENDPREMVYIWVGQNDSEGARGYATLLSLSYSHKEPSPVLQKFHYSGFERSNIRLEVDLSSSIPLASGEPISASHIVTLRSLRDPSSSQSELDTSREHDLRMQIDSSLCLMAWEVWSGRRVHHRLGLFDINQWYQSQMPITMDFSSPTALCPFFSIHSLDRVLSADEMLIDVSLTSVLARYGTVQRSTANLTYAPSALTWGCEILTNVSSFHVEFQCLQQAILKEVYSHGLAALLNPAPFIYLLEYGSIKPILLSQGSLKTQEEKVYYLLNIALEHSWWEFWASCLHSWSENGAGTRMLSTMVNWAWMTLGQLRALRDSLLERFWMSKDLERNAARKLRDTEMMAEYLAHMMKMIINKAPDFTSQESWKELGEKREAVELFHRNFKILSWFQRIGYHIHSYPFPYLQQLYVSLREKQHNSLLIDAFVHTMGKPAEREVEQLWEGKYPPPSFRSLISITLVPCDTYESTLCILLYGIMDIMDSLPERLVEVRSRLERFPSVVSLPRSLQFLTKALWLIDHQEYSAGVELLRSSEIRCGKWNVDWAVRACVLALKKAGELKLTCEIIRAFQVMPEARSDREMVLDIMAGVQDIGKAVEFLRSWDDQQLYWHFFQDCMDQGWMQELLPWPWTIPELDFLENFLRISSNPNSPNYLASFFLIRRQCEEAVQLQSKVTDPLLKETLNREAEEGEDSVFQESRKRLASEDSQYSLQASKRFHFSSLISDSGKEDGDQLEIEKVDEEHVKEKTELGREKEEEQEDEQRIGRIFEMIGFPLNPRQDITLPPQPPANPPILKRRRIEITEAIINLEDSRSISGDRHSGPEEPHVHFELPQDMDVEMEMTDEEPGKEPGVKPEVTWRNQSPSDLNPILDRSEEETLQPVLHPSLEKEEVCLLSQNFILEDTPQEELTSEEEDEIEIKELASEPLSADALEMATNVQVEIPPDVVDTGTAGQPVEMEIEDIAVLPLGESEGTEDDQRKTSNMLGREIEIENKSMTLEDDKRKRRSRSKTPVTEARDVAEAKTPEDKKKPQSRRTPVRKTDDSESKSPEDYKTKLRSRSRTPEREIQEDIKGIHQRQSKTPEREIQTHSPSRLGKTPQKGRKMSETGIKEEQGLETEMPRTPRTRRNTQEREMAEILRSPRMKRNTQHREKAETPKSPRIRRNTPEREIIGTPKKSPPLRHPQTNQRSETEKISEEDPSRSIHGETKRRLQKQGKTPVMDSQSDSETMHVSRKKSPHKGREMSSGTQSTRELRKKAEMPKAEGMKQKSAQRKTSPSKQADKTKVIEVNETSEEDPSMGSQGKGNRKPGTRGKGPRQENQVDLTGEVMKHRSKSPNSESQTNITEEGTKMRLRNKVKSPENKAPEDVKKKSRSEMQRQARRKTTEEWKHGQSHKRGELSPSSSEPAEHTRRLPRPRRAQSETAVGLAQLGPTTRHARSYIDANGKSRMARLREEVAAVHRLERIRLELEGTVDVDPWSDIGEEDISDVNASDLSSPSRSTLATAFSSDSPSQSTFTTSSSVTSLPSIGTSTRPQTRPSKKRGRKASEGSEVFDFNAPQSLDLGDTVSLSSNTSGASSFAFSPPEFVREMRSSRRRAGSESLDLGMSSASGHQKTGASSSSLSQVTSTDSSPKSSSSSVGHKRYFLRDKTPSKQLKEEEADGHASLETPRRQGARRRDTLQSMNMDPIAEEPAPPKTPQQRQKRSKM
ncbi:unnamed protein product [Darwinula stevensoni]|uniref:Protein ELYS n=1 Tax=Darwinula stevensoni TaxID=69355 RepID=A0A7R8XB30_9CRUS|nr:unnamed protein product [Darwinula stevensoni]CAG0890866.1 unnamed protein product [Darwinula stevensoni]